MKKKNKKVSNKKNMEKTQKYKTTQGYSKANKKSNNVKKAKKKHPKLMLAIKIIILLFVLLLLIGGGIIAGIISGLFGDDFKLSEDELKVSNLNTEIYDRDGKLIATLNGDESRKWIDIGDMSEYLPIAFVSIEDERFYEHQGVDVKRTLAATVKYILSKFGIGSSDYGGSTITQQLVKNLTKENEREISRKITEMARAYNLEKTLSKQQILELYLNLIFLGGQSYGVEMGAQYYFSKSASELSLAECAYLAGINNSPNLYEPFSDDEKEIDFIKNRVKTVLIKMNELGNIKSQEDYSAAIAETEAGLAFKNGGVIQNVYSYHTDAAIDQILAQIADENPDWSDVRVKQYLYGGGLRIYTTQNSWVQGILEDVVDDEKFQKASKKNEGAVTQTAMVIIDHKTGQVAATVGGSGKKTVSRGFNFATMQPRQTGSAMKPISVIAPAIQNGIITAGSVYDDVTTKIGQYRYGWPVNYDYTYPGLSTVRYQIQVSHNIVPCKILNEMGIDKSIEYLKSCGVTSLVDDPSKEYNDLGLAQLALGGLTNGITPLQVAAAYAAIANDGEYISPTFYTRVEDVDGNIVMEPKQERRRVLSVENAYIVKSILTQPVLAGTATFCTISGMEVAAKTGTTDDNNDRWLCGFTPYFTAASWFGYKDKENITGYSQNPAGQVWIAAMRRAHAGLPNARFEKPTNITYATICKDSGMLATELCAQDQRGSRVYTEVYVKGTTPAKRCDCHVKLNVCGEEENYKIANEYCPDAKEVVFITRKDSDKNNDWKKAKDAKYMAPTEVCKTHKKHAESKNNNAINNTITNTTNKNNTVNKTTNNTINNKTTNTIKNESVKNTVVITNTSTDNIVNTVPTSANIITNNITNAIPANTVSDNSTDKNKTNDNAISNNSIKNLLE